MAEMVYIYGSTGSKLADAACPRCGRISRQTLAEEYARQEVCALAEAHTCPICQTAYDKCSVKKSGDWFNAYARYLRDSTQYIETIAQAYQMAHSIRDVISAPAPISAARAAPAERVSIRGASPQVLPPLTPAQAQALNKKVEYWQSQLLDFGKRNKMINYRKTKRATLGILEPDFNTLFNRLALDEDTLTFKRPIIREPDIEVYTGDILAEGSYQESKKTLKNLRAKSKLARDEQGANILYLCFGFLEWRENDSPSSPWLTSPLIMMPVSLTHDSIHAPFALSRYDDEIEINPTLDYLFNYKYAADLPTFALNDADSIEQYMRNIEKFADERGWKVNRAADLGLVSFLKISMHHDLENNREQLEDSALIRAITGSGGAFGALPDGFERLDFDRVPPSDWYQVVNSDSSQQEAILRSKQGVSYVMQGPPGTGKSQTITNIIAEALADGKRVLFVSEKAAALQVVLKRLSGVKLDDFCLALHSHKANKKQILDSIGANLKLKRARVKDGVLAELDTLFRDREYLNQYARELHAPITPLGESLFGAFGKLSALSEATELAFEIMPEGIDADRLSALVYIARNYENALNRMEGGLSDSPWHMTTLISAAQAEQARFAAETNGLDARAEALCGALDALGADFGLDIPRTFASARGAAADFAQIMNISDFPPEWLNAEKREELMYSARECAALASEYERGRMTLFEYYDEAIFDIDPGEWISDVSTRVDTLQAAWWNKDLAHILADADDMRDYAYELESELSAISRDSIDAARLLGAPEDDSIESAGKLGAIIDALTSETSVMREWFDDNIWRKASEMCEEASARAQKYRALRDALLNDWETEVFRVDAEAMLKRFKTEHTGLFKALKRGYRNDVKTIRGVSRRVGANISDADIIALLQNLKTVRASQQWFIANAEALAALFGAHDNFINADWARISGGLNAASAVRALFAPGKIPEGVIALLTDGAARASAHASLEEFARSLSAQAINNVLEKFADAVALIPDPESASISSVLLPRVYELREACQALLERIDQMRALERVQAKPYKSKNILCGFVCARIEPEQMFEHMRQALSARGTLDKLNAAAPDCAARFRSRYTGVNTDWNSIAAELDIIEAFCNSDAYKALGETRALGIFGDARSKRALGEALSALNARADDTQSALDAFARRFLPEADFANAPLRALAARYKSCLNGFEALDRLLDYKEARAACAEHGLADFVNQIEMRERGVPDALNAFLRRFYTLWLESAIERMPSVARFRRSAHDAKIAEFQALDEKQLSIAQARVREKVISRFPDPDRMMSAQDELKLLKQELSKKRRIMPLRKLFAKIPNLLMTLKPCLMMSPLSVAYFLEAKSYQFDMVIFDEASQIFPQDAIGAIFRGKQVIIAGDSKQLPPTNFFAASTSNDDYDYDADDDEYEDIIYDSILEAAAGVLPDCTLLWHYRSKHEHLIAFSNREIYKDELITFPSSVDDEPDMGVEFIFVEDGVYESGGLSRNLPEARKVAELVKRHLDAYPERSLGVIAFSEKQQQAISDEIQRFREANTAYERFFAEGHEDEFFVKNLENVQGDERDTIIFSVCYARTREQIDSNRPMAMRFGPLGHAGGERRLNVAITRAKRNIKLVSSILPSDIDLSRTSAEGIRMLRSYIEFARVGADALRSGQSDARQDEFVNAVAAYIEARGFGVRRHVGCSGYKIDIAVEHPAQAGRFIAAVECDGYSYAAAKTARDRDHLRKDVLTGMGWNVYRVWSAEWFRNPSIEGERLMKYIGECVERERPDAPDDVCEAEVLTEEVRKPPAPPPDNPYGFEYYPAIPANPAALISETDARRIAASVRAILRREQPVGKETIYQRMAGAFGRLKVTQTVKRAVDGALATRAAADIIADAHGFYKLANFTDLRVRIPRPGEEPRAIDTISPDEIELAMRVVAQHAFGPDADALLDETSRALGYARRGERIQAVLLECFERLVARGELTVTDGKVTVAENAPPNAAKSNQ